ncbi:bis(5'-nucleosyl)-tetraphosphatase, symmetrical [bacterium BMS3Bbin12]|nr:bis(5'-nucleosyl)-tetraphosphatase, symmetrical [bacterium BMS3Abin12]GBE47342.1 bis(5'-nucleosyl)-tetraphosphatase, symmetrical [bacterium BMS3Bbin12]GBE50352.1 bis(5'-nucleosyl)-tetraphosphatase, symmetrical [bacterium BMS3Bbin13]HDK03753.1 symmetrical bis(5'-nucleosyl)-tetraphosphatase [Gammaproteobacteria bacterium]
MAVYAIGDLHGCLDELRRLLERLSFDPAHDRLWFTGDLVNRGPHSLECLRFVRGLGERAVTVLGNHDLHLLARTVGAADDRHGRDTLDAVLAAPDRGELLEWLRRRPLLHHDPALGYTLIHAGLPPQWDLASARTCAVEVEQALQGPQFTELMLHLYGNRPNRWSPNLAGWDRLRFSINCFTRLRYCSDDGRLALGEKGPPGTQPAPFRPWFSVPGRASAGLRLIFGHWSTLGPCSEPGVFPLDTGCVWGGRLTALRLDGEPHRTHVPCPTACTPRAD